MVGIVESAEFIAALQNHICAGVVRLISHT
jgi:hypothetical protein